MGTEIDAQIDAAATRAITSIEEAGRRAALDVSETVRRVASELDGLRSSMQHVGTLTDLRRASDGNMGVIVRNISSHVVDADSVSLNHAYPLGAYRHCRWWVDGGGGVRSSRVAA